MKSDFSKQLMKLMKLNEMMEDGMKVEVRSGDQLKLEIDLISSKYGTITSISLVVNIPIPT